ncbi:MAG: alpha/beta hydrolase [Pseudomonadota bacterium]
MSKELYQHLVAEGEAGKPLVFAFHGTGGDERQFFDLAQELVPGATVVSPRGDVSEFGAARFFKRTGEGVYDMEDLGRAVEKMAAFVGAWSEEHNGPVYGFGYSNGANILAATVMAHPKLFDRVGLLHPLIPWAPEPVDLDGMRALITAGRRDPITPWAESARLIDWFADQGAQVGQIVHEGGHEIQREEIIALHGLLAGAPVTA